MGFRPGYRAPLLHRSRIGDRDPAAATLLWQGSPGSFGDLCPDWPGPGRDAAGGGIDDDDRGVTGGVDGRRAGRCHARHLTEACVKVSEAGARVRATELSAVG